MGPVIFDWERQLMGKLNRKSAASRLISFSRDLLNFYLYLLPETLVPRALKFINRMLTKLGIPKIELKL